MYYYLFDRQKLYHLVRLFQTTTIMKFRLIDLETNTQTAFDSLRIWHKLMNKIEMKINEQSVR